MAETSVENPQEAKNQRKRWALAAAVCLAAGLCAVFCLGGNRFEPPTIQGVKEEVVVYMDDDIQAALLDGVTAVGGEDRPNQTFPVQVQVFRQEEEVAQLQPGTYRLVYRCGDEKERDALPVESVLVVRPEDTQAPVIEGARDLTVEAGGSISYRDGVTVTDNVDKKVLLMVDAGQVNTAQPGAYPVTYSAQDARGNQTSVTVMVTVEEPEKPAEDGTGEDGITREMLDGKADEILAQLLTPGMTQREQARAIFDYVHGHIKYVGTSDKSGWIKGAYVGITQGRGDCFNYFACSKVLLTRAGIPNIDLERVGGLSDHYWQLVNTGDGWYHFDACPHPNAHPITAFMLTEAEAREYTEQCADVRKNYYVYDYEACGVTVEGTPEEAGQAPDMAEQVPEGESQPTDSGETA